MPAGGSLQMVGPKEMHYQVKTPLSQQMHSTQRWSADAKHCTTQQTKTTNLMGLTLNALSRNLKH